MKISLLVLVTRFEYNFEKYANSKKITMSNGKNFYRNGKFILYKLNISIMIRMYPRIATNYIHV